MTHPRTAALIAQLSMKPHPEGGWYAEVFRSPHAVQTADGRPPRVALTTIDFLLERGQASAWHRVRSDEVWHLLEGDSLTLWLLPPQGGPLQQVLLSATTARRFRQQPGRRRARCLSARHDASACRRADRTAGHETAPPKNK